MGRKQAGYGAASITVMAAIGCAPMIWPTLEPSVGIPIMAGLLIFAACSFIWAYTAPEGEDKDVAATLTPDLPASGSNAIKGIASGDSWKKLNALLHSGEIMAWSRTEGYKNLRPIRPERWFNGSLEFLPSGDSFVADPGDLRPRPWKKDAAPTMNGRDYDIHFNRAQLKKHWPDLF